MCKAIISIDGYLAVIPKIQNAYPIERVKTGWQTGFKYESGVFEFFVYKTRTEAKTLYNRIQNAIDEYYEKGGCKWKSGK